MQNFLSSKKVLWLFIGVGVLAILVALITALAYRGKNQTAQPAIPVFPKFEVKHTQVPDTQLPDKFPAGLPLEANAKVLDNFNSSAQDGSYQATRQYESAKSPADNYKLFEAYFKKNGYATLSSSAAGAEKTLTVKKDTVVIRAQFYTNTVSKASVVKLSVSLPAPAPATK